MSLPATAVLLLALVCGSQARPSETPEPNSSVDVSDSYERDVAMIGTGPYNMSVLSKVEVLCAPRPPEQLQLEEQCALEAPPDCPTAPAPPTESTAATAVTATAVATEGAAEAEDVTDATPAVSITTDAPQEECRTWKACNYHFCLLKKMKLLNSSDMPDKTLLTNWAENLRDEKQREATKLRTTICIKALEEVFGVSDAIPVGLEEQNGGLSAEAITLPENQRCTAAQKVVSCLVTSTACPAIQM